MRFLLLLLFSGSVFGACQIDQGKVSCDTPEELARLYQAQQRQQPSQLQSLGRGFSAAGKMMRGFSNSPGWNRGRTTNCIRTYNGFRCY